MYNYVINKKKKKRKWEREEGVGGREKKMEGK